MHRAVLAPVLWLLAVTGAGRIAAQETVRITRGPYLQALLDTSVEILWLTDEAHRGAVRHGEDGEPQGLMEESEAGTFHRLRLDGLEPDRRYLYEVLDGGSPLAGGGPFSFRTAPPMGTGSFRAVALGDSGTGDEDQLTVAELIPVIQPDIFLHTGDIDYEEDVDESVFGPYREILAGACLYPSRGNHDEDLPWRDFFFPPAENPEGTGTYYSYDWGSTHFTVLDTEESVAPDSAQGEWAEEDLAAARAAGREWLILYCHRPPYSLGRYNDASTTLRMRRWIPPLVDRHAVDLVLCGHDHNYQRTYPVRGGTVQSAEQEPDYVAPAGAVYVITGGGGRGLYEEDTEADHSLHRLFLEVHHLLELEISPEEIAVRAVGVGGETLDRFTIRKAPRPPDIGFLRGDVNLSSSVNIVDAIAILDGLFSGSTLACPMAADTDDSGLPPILSDAIFLLNYLFLGGKPVAPPYPNCGPAPEPGGEACLQVGCGIQ